MARLDDLANLASTRMSARSIAALMGWSLARTERALAPLRAPPVLPIATADDEAGAPSQPGRGAKPAGPEAPAPPPRGDPRPLAQMRQPAPDPQRLSGRSAMPRPAVVERRPAPVGPAVLHPSSRSGYRTAGRPAVRPQVAPPVSRVAIPYIAAFVAEARARRTSWQNIAQQLTCCVIDLRRLYDPDFCE